MLGGLARRAGAIKEIREKGAPILLFDAGNALFERRSYTSKDMPLVRKKADFILKSYQEMGYQAINIGIQDWGGGSDYLLTKINEQRYPFVSVSLEGESPKLILPPHFIILDAYGCKVGVIGVMGNQSQYIEEGYPGVAVSDPVRAIRDVVARLERECPLIILLSDLGPEMDADIARQVEGVDIIIESGTGGLRSPVKVKGTYLCRPRPDGQSLGCLELAVTPAGYVIEIEDQMLVLDDRVPEDNKMRSEVEAFFKEQRID